MGSCFIYTAFVAKFLSFVFNYFILFFDYHYAYNVQCAFSSGMSVGLVLFWFIPVCVLIIGGGFFAAVLIAFYACTVLLRMHRMSV